MTAPARVYENGDLLRRVRELQALMSDLYRNPSPTRTWRVADDAHGILAEMAEVLRTTTLARLGGTS